MTVQRWPGRQQRVAPNAAQQSPLCAQSSSKKQIWRRQHPGERERPRQGKSQVTSRPGNLAMHSAALEHAVVHSPGVTRPRWHCAASLQHGLPKSWQKPSNSTHAPSGAHSPPGGHAGQHAVACSQPLVLNDPSGMITLQKMALSQVDRSAELGAEQIRFDEATAAQVRAAEVGAAQIGVGEVRVAQVRAAHVLVLEERRVGEVAFGGVLALAGDAVLARIAGLRLGLRLWPRP